LIFIVNQHELASEFILQTIRGPIAKHYLA
jgi:hypothetical protein